MKLNWKRMLAVLCAAVLMLSALPVIDLPSVTAVAAAKKYGVATINALNVRQDAKKDSTSLFKIEAGTVVEILGLVDSNGEAWYRVSVENPATKNDWRMAYIQAEYVREMTWAEQVLYEDLINHGTSTIALGQILAEVNLRVRPSVKASLVSRLERESAVLLLTIPNDADVDGWYKVQVDDLVGYVKHEYVRVITRGNLTPLPVLESAPIDTSDLSLKGHVKVVQSNVRACEIPNGRTCSGYLTKNQVLDCVGTTYSYASGSTWYAVLLEGKTLAYLDAAWVEPCSLAGASKDYLSTEWDVEDHTIKGYVKTTLQKVFVRATASTSAAAVDQIANAGTTMPYFDTMKPSGSTIWYRVKTPSNVEGWVIGSCVAPIVPDVTPDPDRTNTPTPTGVTPEPIGPVKGYVVMNTEKVYVREKPGTKNKALQLVMTKETMPYYDVSELGSVKWYQVRTAAGTMGWMSGQFLNQPDVTPTPPPVVTTPPAPTVPPVVPVKGYVVMNTEKVYVREKPGTTNKALQLVMTKETMPYYDVTELGKVKWYQVCTAAGTVGWMSGQFLNQPDVTPTPPPVVTTPPVPTVAPVKGYVTMTTEKVYVRSGAGTSYSAKTLVINKETMPYYDTNKVGSVVWYKVKTAAGVEGWMSGKFLTEQKIDPTPTPVPTNPTDITPTPVPTDPDTTPTPTPTPGPTYTPGAILGYVTMTMTKVYVREEPGSSAKTLGLVVNKETMPYYQKAMIGSTTWFEVKTSTGLSGWMSGECLKVTQVIITDPPVTPTPAPTTTTKYIRTTANKVNVRDNHNKTNSKVIAQIPNANTRLPYTATAVDSNKVTWYYVTVDANTKGWIISTYAVMDVAPGPDDGKQLHPAEKVDWFSGVIQGLWQNGVAYPVYDVRTGKTWMARKLYGSYHADVEPLTAADTAILCEIYGVSKASQITEKTHYQRRPSLVTIGGRTFACSLYGVPHGDQAVTNNNYEGQACLHFVNSKIHRSGEVDPEHQKAIQEAWERCPAGHK